MKVILGFSVFVIYFYDVGMLRKFRDVGEYM